MSQFDSSKDYYSILGADEDATRSEIERLYKRLAARRHPDRGGSEEEMKALNEAYGVLRDEATRNAYDTERRKPADVEAPPHASPPAQADAVSGQLVTALLFIALGLVLLLVVRFHYILFLWPLALLALFLIFVGVVQAHAAMRAIRGTLALSHPARRYTLLQEVVFWSVVCGGCYVVFLVLSAG